MRRFLLALCLLITSTTFLHAQRKSDLIAEIEVLKTEIDSMQTVVVEAKKNEKIGTTKAESLENQVNELKDANATLLKNLNNFAKITNTNSENLNKALAKLDEKEGQLGIIRSTFASHDSTSLVVLTNAKQTLGEDAKVGVSNGSVIIAATLESLFGKTTEATVIETAEPWLEKIAAILKANPKVVLTLRGLSMTGELDLAAKQANAVKEVLATKFEVNPERIDTLGKDGNFKEGVNFVIHPDFKEFYTLVKGHMKDSN